MGLHSFRIWSEIDLVYNADILSLNALSMEYFSPAIQLGQTRRNYKDRLFEYTSSKIISYPNSGVHNKLIQEPYGLLEEDWHPPSLAN
jgi:hypothetical protein